MKSGPLEKDVEAQLLSKKTSRRKAGAVPYPLEYTADLVNFDQWDQMFLMNCCRSITLHDFSTPPKMVLDLGCGGGYWAIQAAQQWKDSTIIGFDIKDLQPRLSNISLYSDISARIKWVHGNLLDPLPFPSNCFDFVRIVGIGLGVPEDEWQSVLEEVARVMKPAAVMEIIEDDLIFPCGRPPKRRPPPLAVNDLPPGDSIPSSTLSTGSSLLSQGSTLNPDDHYVVFPVKKQPSLVTLHESPMSSPRSPNSSFHIPPTLSSPTDEYVVDPQDHTKLKEAWEAMLANRFLAPQLVTVLPFYLSSTFIDIQTHSALQISLPPNSSSSNSSRVQNNPEPRDIYHEFFDPDVLFDLKMSRRTSTDTGDNASLHSQKSSHRTVSSWAPMHLAKMVRTIIGCQESIWIEYEKLFSDDPSIPLVTRTSRPKDIQLQIQKASAREAFDRAWANWESDMMDRIGMRGLISAECSWPENNVAGEIPNWRQWRSALDAKSLPVQSQSSKNPELCRSLRGFIGRKPS